MALQVPIVEFSTRSDASALGTPQARWALERVRRSGVTVVEQSATGEAAAGTALVLDVLSDRSPDGAALLASRNVALDEEFGAYALLGIPGQQERRVALVIREATGCMYGLLEFGQLLSRGQPLEVATVVRSPATRVRAVGRAFTSAQHDLTWYRSEQFWLHYLDMLAENRFNQLDLALGIAYDFPIHITDAYFLFAYPFLLDVPGHGVSAEGLSSEDREQNLAMLKFIARESARRSVELHLGLWTHSYHNADSPTVNYTIQGMDDSRHAEYCRDALGMLLTECPEIRGITLRTHGESGVPEGTEKFWASLFGAVPECRVAGEFTIDLHAKGLTYSIVDLALEAGARTVISAKFSAEHMGLPYQQAAVRDIDRLGRQSISSGKAEDAVRETAHRLMGLSLHSRSATRYSYGDFLATERRHEVIYRIWPGTQKLLTWSDPVFADSYARASRFCGSSGLELMEPLSFRGRRGSGLGSPERRDGYHREVETPWTWDWEKYRDGYAVWGRALFGDAQPLVDQTNPHAPTDVHVLNATATASRILPLVTSAHCPSAACVHYWPEIYTIPPISRKREDGAANIYRGDSMPPVRLGTVAPVDPTVFSSAREFAEAVASGAPDGRYSLLDVADWLDHLVGQTESEATAARRAGNLTQGDALRLADAEALARLGTYFSALFQVAVAYELFDLTGKRNHLARAVVSMEEAIGTWTQLAAELDELYVDDVSFGEVREGRGCWRDRVALMHEELAQLRSELVELAEVPAGSTSADELPGPLLRRLPPPRGTLSAPSSWSENGDVTVRIDLAAKYAAEEDIAFAQLHYRPVNQFAAWATSPMARLNPWAFAGAIPAEALGQGFPVQYFCEVVAKDGRAARLPGLGALLNETPYRIVFAATC